MPKVNNTMYNFLKHNARIVSLNRAGGFFGVPTWAALSGRIFLGGK